MDLPTVSVIIPFTRGEHSIFDCLASVFEMDYPMEKLEVIAVDNSHDDATSELIRKCFPTARVVRDGSGTGSDGAKQAGIDAATGDLIALTDADCIVPWGWARSIAKNLDDGAEAVTGPVRHPRTLLREVIGIADFPDCQSEDYRCVTNFPGCNVGIRADVARNMGYRSAPDSRFGSDRLLSWRMHTRGLRIRYDPAMAVRHFPDVSLGHLLERRMRYGRKALRLRRLDLSLPGAVITRLGPLSAPAYVVLRTAKDLCRLTQMTWRRQVNPWHAPFILPMLILFRLIDALGVATASYASEPRPAHHRLPQADQHEPIPIPPAR